MAWNNAYESRETYNDDGQLIHRERVVGAIVIWAIVALTAILTGYALLPASFSAFLKG